MESSNEKLTLSAEGYLEPSPASKMELFAKIVPGKCSCIGNILRYSQLKNKPAVNNRTKHCTVEN